MSAKAGTDEGAESDEPVRFAHESEEEFTRILDFYRVAWQYEPRTFPLKEEEGRLVEAFTPDFYLPDLDLYIELTTLKQSLVTQKHGKIRRFQERYPDLQIKLLHRSDYLSLLAKYGFGPFSEVEVAGIEGGVFSVSGPEGRVDGLGAPGRGAGRRRALGASWIPLPPFLRLQVGQAVTRFVHKWSPPLCRGIT